jgi:hypothetical protein
MKVTKDAGGWLKADETKTGELLRIMQVEEVEKKDFNGEDKLVIQLTVRTGGDEVRKLDLNSTSKNNVIDAYGDETDEWIDKHIRVEIVNQKVGKDFKDVLYVTHPSKNVKGELIT